MSATLTAERSHEPAGAVGQRIVYRLSEPVRTDAYPHPFEHVALSRGRLGDTCVFPSDEEGNLLDLVGFGFGMGLSRYLTDDEADAFVTACIAQHLTDGGAGLKFAPAGWEAES